MDWGDNLTHQTWNTNSVIRIEHVLTAAGAMMDGFNMAYAQDRSYRVTHHGAELLPPDLGVLEAQTASPGNLLNADGLTIRMLYRMITGDSGAATNQ